MLALASRRERAIASPTESGTCEPPGASRKANPLCSALKRARTAVGSIVSAAISLLGVGGGTRAPRGGFGHSAFPGVEALDERGAGLPQLRQLALRDQLSQH